jgi:hypothetical protein
MIAADGAQRARSILQQMLVLNRTSSTSRSATLSISKRVLALAGAGVAALVLGGSVGVFHHGATTLAGAPTNGAVGCATSSASIQFPTSVAGPTGLIIGPEISQAATGATNTSGNGYLSLIGASSLSTLSVGFGGNAITCGAVLQDSGAGNATTGGDTDLNANTVDGGVITYTTTGPVSILPSSSALYALNCGATIPANTIVAPFVSNETCQGAVPVGAAIAAVTPNPGNTVQVQLATNTSLGAIGFSGLGTGATISASYTRFPAISATAATFSAGTAPIAFIQPSYALVLSVSNGTITAGLPNATIAQQANTTSVVTTSTFRSTTVPCQVITGVAGFICGNSIFNGTVTNVSSPFLGGASTLYYAPGIEPSVITYQTNLGVWVGSSQTGGALVSNSYAQTISVQCGNQPGTNPLIVSPLLGQASYLGLTSCTTSSATLAGGGEAGTAAIVVSSIGDFTGTEAQATTEVNLVPGPSTVNLSTGCNEVITPPSLAPGSNSAAVLKLVTGFNVTSIWMFNNATHTFQALYFSASGAPTDISAVGPGQSIFVCGTGAGTFQVSP